MVAFVSLVCGILFGVGLAASGMTDPAKVQGFLDIFGYWDPSLIFVMGGAVTLTLITFRFVLKRQKPVLAETFDLPTTTQIDKKLLIGAALFGIGWGISGFCPGPAIASVAYLNPDIGIFLVSMFGGAYLGQWILDKT